jgi:hypothetical protein
MLFWMSLRPVCHVQESDPREQSSCRLSAPSPVIELTRGFLAHPVLFSGSPTLMRLLKPPTRQLCSDGSTTRRKRKKPSPPPSARLPSDSLRKSQEARTGTRLDCGSFQCRAHRSLDGFNRSGELLWNRWKRRKRMMVCGVCDSRGAHQS